MRFEMTSWTDVAIHALYDPTVAKREHKLDGVHASAATGDLLAIDAGDGDLGLGVYLDEPIPADFEARVQNITRDILLRVPSGRLCATGLENIGDEAEMKASTISVPPGDYLVDAYDLEFDWDRDIDPVLVRELGSSYKRELRLGGFGGAVLLGGLVSAVLGLVLWRPGVLIAGILGILIGIGALRLGVPGADFEARRDAIVRRFPSVVLVLRRLPADADLAAYHGAVLHTEG